MRIRRREEEHVEIQMAPLIDIVFLLLIFFLLTTTVQKPEKPGEKPPLELPLELPHSAAAIESPQQEELLILGIDKEGNKFVGREPMTTALLHQRVREAARQNPRQRVRIDADRAAKYEDVVEVIELCQFEGLRNIGLHTAPEKVSVPVPGQIPGGVGRGAP